MADKKQNKRNNKNYDEDYNPRFRKQRKKVCVLCSDKNFVLDYKNPEQLKKFINDKAIIFSSPTGFSSNFYLVLFYYKFREISSKSIF